MPLRKWNAYRVLNITSRDSDSMSCTGKAVSRGNARCRIGIPPGEFKTIRVMLDKMESKPPDEVFDMLPRLARLSLCEEYHRRQREDVVAMWEDALDDVVEDYNKAKKLQKRNKSLENELAKETEERMRLEGLLSEDSNKTCDCKETMADIEKLKATALDDSKHHEMELFKAEGDRTVLVLRLAKLRKSSDKRSQELEQMKTLMAEQKAEMSRQLAAERKASEQYKIDAEASRAVVENKSKLIDNLHSDLSKERQFSARHQEELQGTDIKQRFLSSQIAELLPQLAAASQASEQLKEEVNEGVANRKALIQQVETLQSQFSTEQQHSCKLKKDLQEVEKNKAILSEEMESLSSQLGTERRDKDGLGREVRDTKAGEATLKAQLENIQGVLERTRLDLTRDRQTNDEQRAASDAREAASAAEIARMIERIRELEMESSAGCLGTFRAKVRRLGKRSQP